MWIFQTNVGYSIGKAKGEAAAAKLAPQIKELESTRAASLDFIARVKKETNAGPKNMGQYSTNDFETLKNFFKSYRCLVHLALPAIEQKVKAAKTQKELDGLFGDISIILHPDEEIEQRRVFEVLGKYLPDEKERKGFTK